MKKFLKENKESVIIATAIIVPFGLTVLGAWKVVDLIKKQVKKDKEKENENTEN